MPFTFEGFFRKSWKSLNRPCPTVPPKADGCRSERSNRNVFARASASAVARLSGSLYALGGTFLFGEEKPPCWALIVAGAGVARYVTNARAAVLSLNMITLSPPPTTAGAEPPTDGNGKTL